jgi:ribosome maturation factor RimP
MIDKDLVKRLVVEKLDERMFIVDISVSESNRIDIFIDGYDGLTIDQCVAVSRNVEHNLDREAEDFSLQVSSPGLSEKFRVKEQYIKYQGKLVEVITTEGTELEGTLISAGEEGIVLETSVKEKPEGGKKKELIIKQYQFKYEEIKSAKAVISFK